MDRLWSPWRGAHVARAAAASREALDPADHDPTDRDASAAAGPSVFSRIAGEPERDRENGVVWRGPTAYAVLNLYPYTNGHLLLIPYREVAAYDALTAEERAELAELTARAMRWLRRALAPDGFNVGLNQGAAAGAGIPRHLHLHVVPRWHGDTNFMPVVGEAKVIPEALAVTYAKLLAAVDEA